MNKKFLICGLLSVTILSTSCLGSFSAFNSLRDWNDGLTNNKFMDNLVFWALNIVPVYSLFIAGDVLFFNLLEFWTGSNPIAMAEGETETQYANIKGTDVRMTASKNKFDIAILSGENESKEVNLLFVPEDKSWNAVDENGALTKLASMEDGFYLIHTPEGESIKIDPNASNEVNMAILENKLEQSGLRYVKH
ncbi:DUF3332 domain-containing protein [Psychroflexus salis]|uniref:Membrane protein n=1 Tax=Psychroflexus salis TaxID=1526574 RepID=A0A916ZS12_9FLAO|nr:DUF3332 domain-containing protein [Psychroflexus salis]GGE08569.1 membrane protein [Psychroflexus salis]